MNCRDLQDRIAPFLDGELPADEYRAAETHLLDCPACQDALLRASQTPIGLAHVATSPPPDLQERIDQALQAERHRPKTRVERVAGWLGGDVRVSRRAILAYLLLLASALAWGLGNSATPDLASQPLPPPPTLPGQGTSPIAPASHRGVRQIY